MNKSNNIDIVKSQNAGEIIFELTEQNKNEVPKLRNFDLVYFLCPQCNKYTERPVPYYRYKVGLPVCYNCRKENMRKKISESEIKTRNKNKEDEIFSKKAGEIPIRYEDIKDFSQIRALDKIIYTCSCCGKQIVRAYCKLKKCLPNLDCQVCNRKKSLNIPIASYFYYKNELKLTEENVLKFKDCLKWDQKITFTCAKCGEEVHKTCAHFNYKLLCENCKTIETSQKRYGVDNVFQLLRVRESAMKAFQENKEEIIEKKRANAMAKYGIPNAANTPEAMAKYKATCIEKYGCLPICSKESREKAQQTCLERYGDEFPLRSKTFRDNNFSNYLYDGEYFDSTWELAFYIYHKDKKSNITRSHKSIKYTFNSEEHRYFPDFEIDGKFFEVKSPYLYEQLLVPNTVENAKLNCMKENNAMILTDCTKYLKYIERHYGKDYFEQFKQRNKKDEDNRLNEPESCSTN